MKTHDFERSEDDRRLVPTSRTLTRQCGQKASAHARLVWARFKASVTDDTFPCVMGRGAIIGHRYRFGLYPALGTHEAARALTADLAWFGRERLERDSLRGRYSTYISVFEGPLATSDDEFHVLLWRQLQAMNAHDALSGAAWDPAVSPDPTDPSFSFSIGGVAYFLVGMHPGSHRFARRFVQPAIAWNAHEQFERLREEGKFDKARSAIRSRDVALQGSVNSNLADFGDASEALQYSGKPAPEGCPFRNLHS